MKKTIGLIVLVAIGAVFISVGCKQKERSDGKYRIAETSRRCIKQRDSGLW
ncbi:MAG: hypothetical protein JSV82_03520 [Planctomycetota bacterium]|nr:MAG: hypothetical protein JSV82_03520 [Planctomycetota bacterium]